jgi:outer membrane receptor protein involved in Fe transport
MVEGEPINPLTANEEMTESEGEGVDLRPGVYGELEVRPVKKLALIGGARFDYFENVEKASLDPRLVVRYKLFEPTTLKAGVGLFHQPPSGFQTDDDFGTPGLELINAVHYSVGVEQEIIDNVDVGLEGFYKDLKNLVVSSEDPAERFNNDGEGQVWGMELLLKHHPTERFFGWISYTLMKSERIDHPGLDPRPFDFDQTHILTIVASAVLGRGWEMGLRFRVVTGNPDTPVIGSVLDADSDIYIPIYGDTNSSRLPTFHQLDYRVDKNWKWKYIKAAIYLDVRNIYNHQNPEGFQYNYDYTKRRYFTGLPVLPSLGLKLEY